MPKVLTTWLPGNPAAFAISPSEGSSESATGEFAKPTVQRLPHYTKCAVT